MSILQAFMSRLEQERDRAIEPWMISWSYQDRKSSAYDGDLPQRFDSFAGPEDLRSWMLWTSQQNRPSYLDEATESQLCAASVDTDRRVLESLGLDPLSRERLEVIGRANAQDFILSQPFDVPDRYRVRRVLDFGAGFGRQANLWFRERPELIYIAVEGIPLSYCLQNLYYSNVTPTFRDYVVEPDTFCLSDQPGSAYHLPTWQMGQIPSGFVDLVMCVQVLPELGRKLLRYVVGEFHRVLKPGGALYLRDHDRAWRPGHGLNTNRLLEKTGFELEFRPHIVDRQDLWGIPRIWRKADPAVIASRARTAQGRLRDWRMVADGMTGGRLGRVYRQLLKK